MVQAPTLILTIFHPVSGLFMKQFQDGQQNQVQALRFNTVQSLVTTTTGSGRYVELDSHKGTDTNTIMVQMLTGLTSGNDYDLSLWYRPRTNNGNDDNGINILWSDTLPFAEPADITASLSSTRNQQNDWMNFTYSLTASSDTMYLGFGAFGADNSLGGFIDDISLLGTNNPGISVPEPAPLALLGFGLGIIALRKKR